MILSIYITAITILKLTNIYYSERLFNNNNINYLCLTIPFGQKVWESNNIIDEVINIRLLF